MADIPRYYGLSFGEQRFPYVEILVDKSIIENDPVCSKNEINRFRSIFPKELSDLSFSDHINAGSFGFLKSIQRVPKCENGFIPFFFQFPEKKEEKCTKCDGTGIDPKIDWDCLECHGGKKISYNWQKVWGLAVSLHLFLKTISRVKYDTSSRLEQLFTIETGVNPGQEGCSVQVTLLEPIIQVLEKIPKGQQIYEMEEAMRTAYLWICGDNHPGRYKVWIADSYGWLNIECPGENAGMFPSGSMGSPRMMQSAHIDSPFQQLALIAAFAALHDKVIS